LQKTKNQKSLFTKNQKNKKTKKPFHKETSSQKKTTPKKEWLLFFYEVAFLQHRMIFL